jgi:hypothetical protein
MNIAVTTGIVSSAAGAPLSQTAGSEAERTAKDAAARERTVDAQQQSERASGIGQTQQDGESGERDADGRRPWEIGAKGKRKTSAEPEAHEPPRQAKDPSGSSGNALDLTG